MTTMLGIIARQNGIIVAHVHADEHYDLWDQGRHLTVVAQGFEALGLEVSFTAPDVATLRSAGLED